MALTPEQLQQLIDSIRTPTTVKHFTHCPARFNGTRSSEAVNDFLASTDFFKETENITDVNALKGLHLLLEGPAYTWWTGVASSAQTWNDAKKLIKDEYAPKLPNYKVYLEVFAKPQGRDEPTGLFVSTKRALLAQVEPQDTEERQLDFVYGLLRCEIKKRITRSLVTTFAQLLTAAREAEENLLEKAKTKPAERPNKEDNTRPEKKSLDRCKYCRALGHTIAVCQKKASRESKATEPRNESSTLKCYGCGTPGVFRRNCSKCNKTPTAAETPLCFIDVQECGRPALEISINGIQSTAYLDTGARTSLASPELFEKMVKANISFRPKQVMLTQADGNSTATVALCATAPVTLKGRTFDTNFIHIPGAPRAKSLLGADFARTTGITIDFKRNLWYLDNRHEAYRFVAKDKSPTETSLTVATIMEDHHPTTLLSPMTSPFTMSPVNEVSHHVFQPQALPLTTNTRPAAHINENTSHPPVEQFFYIASRSQYQYDDAMQAVEYEWNMELPEELACLFPDVQMATLDVLNLRCDNEGHALEPWQMEAMNELLKKYPSLFAPTGPPTPYAEHLINTGNEPPISSPPYRASPAKTAILKKEVALLLQNGIIEECDSAWASPVVLVPKPDGSQRLCIDYRRLNAITVPDTYPLPRLEDLLHSTGNSLYLTTMDLKAGYHQVSVHKADQDKTSFITPFGIYRYRRLPFGLRNAPSTFQRLVDRFKMGLPGVRLLAYLDDFILMSGSFEEHLNDLKLCFDRLEHFKLRLNRPKCFFACAQVKYLGHIISASGIHVNPEKVLAIKDMGRPNDAKQLLTFLQTCNWYRRFIPNFASQAKSLTHLTRKSVAWTWGPVQEEAFQKLKELLTSAPILRQATAGLPYTLRTDASAYAIGAALLQGEGPDERPIEYASRLLTAPEINYTTTEREALALVWAVQKFRGYIEEAETVVITDHRPLKWLMSIKTPSGRLARWALQIQAFNLKIEYTPGKSNVVADTLSRPPRLNAPETTEICLVTVDLPTKGAAEIRAEQMADPDVKKIIDCFENDRPEETSRWTARGYILSQGVLYRYSPEDDDVEEPRLVIPVHQRLHILKKFHDDPTAGHYGTDHTCHKIARKYFWPGMYTQVREYVKACPKCQKYKASNLRPAGLLQTPTLQQRFESIALDLFGPLPTSPDGKNWILIIEDCASRWVELFALEKATADACAQSLLNEVCLRYGVPRRIISDNGTQFISAIMQHLCYCLQIDQSFTPVYHPAANMVERRNRDMKTQLSILLGTTHNEWTLHLPAVRFAMNTTRCQTTGFTPAYLTFARELRSPCEVQTDLRAIVSNENFIPEITPRLLAIDTTFRKAQDTQEVQQDKRKHYADKHRRTAPVYQPGDKVLIDVHSLSKAAAAHTSKFAPKRDGPYVILHVKGPCSYEVAAVSDPATPLGVYHTSALRPFIEGTQEILPVQPIRRRGRPRKQPQQNTTSARS